MEEYYQSNMFPANGAGRAGAEATGKAAGRKAAGRQGADTASQEDPAIARIREIGFQAYVKELNEKKIEELKKKILEAMGYSETDLEKMPAGQRAMIEKIADDEVQRRLAAASLMNRDQEKGSGGTLGGEQDISMLNAQVNVTKRMGLDILGGEAMLMTQTQEQRDRETLKDGLFREN